MADEYRIFLTACSQSEKIRAIKDLRTVFGFGLKESKEFCDRIGFGEDRVLIHATPSHSHHVALFSDAKDCEYISVDEDALLDEKPTVEEIALAIWMAKEFPLEPDDIRALADRLERGPEAVASLRRVANMIETA